VLCGKRSKCTCPRTMSHMLTAPPPHHSFLLQTMVVGVALVPAEGSAPGSTGREWGVLQTIVSHEAVTALRKGAPLLKYCRGGKPHVCLFKLSADEARLTWESRSQKVCAQQPQGLCRWFWRRGPARRRHGVGAKTRQYRETPSDLGIMRAQTHGVHIPGGVELVAFADSCRRAERAGKSSSTHIST
jgi:hypothetical protein